MMKANTPCRRYELAMIAASWLLCGTAGLMIAPIARAQNAAAPRRVVVLHWDNKDFPGNVEFDAGFENGLEPDNDDTPEIYPEYLDSTRFPGPQQDELFHNYLRQKYAGRTIDVVVALADAPLNFLLKNRNDLFPSAPIVFLGVKRPDETTISAGPGLTGLIQASTQRQTLELALKLNPDTKQVFVIS